VARRPRSRPPAAVLDQDCDRMRIGRDAGADAARRPHAL